MDERMQGLHNGDTDAIQGFLSGTPYKLFVMKDAAYNTKLMSTYGSLVEHPDAKLQKRRIGDESTTFRYTEPFHNHYTNSGMLLTTTTTTGTRIFLWKKHG